MKRILVAIFLFFAASVPAIAQCNGIFGANTLCGNNTALPALPVPTPKTAFITVPGGTNGQIEYNNGGAFGGFTMSGDCLTNTTTGVIICTKTNGVVFGPPATGSATGNTTAFLTQSGAIPSGDCIKADSSGNAVDAGACGGTLPGYIFGLTTANDATSDQSNQISVSAGNATDSTNVDNIILSSAISQKKINVAWAVGSNAGCLDTGSITNNTYFIWLIKNTTGPVVDVLCSLSPTAPTMPSGYTEKRRIGSIIRQTSSFTGSVTGTALTVSSGLTGIVQLGSLCTGTGITANSIINGFTTGNGGAGTYTLSQSSSATGSITITCVGNLQFTQDGNSFSLNVPNVDFAINNPGTSAILQSITIPIGIRVQVLLTEALQYSNNANNIAIILRASDPGLADFTPSQNGQATLVMTTINGDAMANTNMVPVYSNLLGQIRLHLSASDAHLTLSGGANGWIDTRGQ